MTYTDEIRAARIIARIKQADLGKALGLSLATMVDLEHGRVGISQDWYMDVMGLIRRLKAEAEARRAA